MRSIVTIGLVFVAACSTDPVPAPTTVPAPVTALPAAATAAALPTPPAPENGAFDSARNRDPFAPGVVAAPPPIADGVARKAKRFTLDDLKLVAIVGGDGTPRAMLVDPRGKGWLVSRGDHVGKAEITDHVTGWRVDKVRDADVVFVKDDSARPDSTEKRVIALRTAEPPVDFADD